MTNNARSVVQTDVLLCKTVSLGKARDSGLCTINAVLHKSSDGCTKSRGPALKVDTLRRPSDGPNFTGDSRCEQNPGIGHCHQHRPPSPVNRWPPESDQHINGEGNVNDEIQDAPGQPSGPESPLFVRLVGHRHAPLMPRLYRERRAGVRKNSATG